MTAFTAPLFAVGKDKAEQADKIPPVLPVEAFADQPTFSNVKLSPDGNQIVYFSVMDGRRVGVVQNLDGSDRMILPPHDEADIVRVEWARDDRLLRVYQFYVRRTYFSKAYAETRLAALSRDGKNLDWIVRPRKVRGSGSKLRDSGINPPWQHDIVSLLPDDPKHILLALDSDMDGAAELRRINVNNGIYKELKGNLRGIQDWYVDHSYTLRVAPGFDPLDQSFTFRVYDPDGSYKDTPVDFEKEYDLLGFTDEENIVDAKKYTSLGVESVFKLSLETGEVIEPVAVLEGIDTLSMNMHPETGLPAGVVYTNDFTHVRYIDKGLNTVKRVTDQGIADQNRICIGGISYGGYTSLLGAVMEPDLYQCAISANGVTNMPRMKSSDRQSSFTAELWQARWGLEGADDETISPYHQAEAIHIPVLLFAAKDDSRVPWEQSAQMADRLTDLGRDVTFGTTELGGHSMTTTEARRAFMSAMESFLAAQIGGKSGPRNDTVASAQP